MTPDSNSAVSTLIERALGLVMSDGEAAARLAGQVMAEGADAEQPVTAMSVPPRACAAKAA